MSRVDPPYPCLTTALVAPEPRNAPSNRLPPYRSSYMGRYHPYPRYGRASCLERLTNQADRRYEAEELWAMEEPVIAPPRLERAAACVEVIDSDASRYDEDPFAIGEEEHSGPPPPSPAATVKLVDAAAALLSALLGRYVAQFQAIKDFLHLEHAKKG
ncbi:hypothetical protein C8Q77DRAFT_1154820 [Trametes polyzona]|nr:hypothetical protein C8Q77DRAFT_1154820 [Trametes polyzona]